MTTIFPVILSGGAGSRLWPLSREHYPKQLLALTGERTMLQQTAMRLDGLPGVQPPVVVCNEEHRFLVAEQLREIRKTPLNIFLEPVGRNTAPALTLAALFLMKHDAQAVMLVMPADHVIPDVQAFQSAVTQAARAASDGYLATFGIVPTKPETGYGYIRKGKTLVDFDSLQHVAEFVEKPDSMTATQYLASGEYLWNSGMFVLRAAVWLDELKRRRPDILQACETAYSQGQQDGEFFRVGKEAFMGCPCD